MPPKFELGQVIVKEDASFALVASGQDADFFLAKHAAGDWGEEGSALNEQGLREGSMVFSRYRTLRGQELLVITFLDCKETYLFCPPPVINSCPWWTWNTGGFRQTERSARGTDPCRERPNVGNATVGFA